MNETQDPISDIFIIGIGASAGGLESFKKFFSGQMLDNIAIVLVQHLDPHHKTYLPDLIKPLTNLEVQLIEDNTPVKSHHIYIAPPQSVIEIDNNRFIKKKSEKDLRFPINYFFRSLANEKKEKAIGIILSGAGSDGTLGLREIKGLGGLAIVESPLTAHYKGMPVSAIDNNIIDFILAPEDMPSKIAEYLKITLEKKEGKTEVEKLDEYLNKIFSLLRTYNGHDFSVYKKNTIMRRITRRMSLNHTNEIKDYIDILMTNKIELQNLFKDFTIGVTNFFRDKEAFNALNEKVLPELIERGKNGIRIWIVGCSTGEEAYSLVILFKEYLENRYEQFKLHIFASDIDEDAIRIARKGEYPLDIRADLSQAQLNDYFIKSDDSYKVKKNIREMIIFASQNVILDPPFSNIDLISCRNLLIYLDTPVQNRLLNLFHYALNENGFLFLGSAESIGQSNEGFKTIDNKHKIFQKHPYYGKKKQIDFHFQPIVDFEYKLGVDQKKKFDKKGIIYEKLVKQKLIDIYTPAGVIINKNKEVVYTHGNVSKFLKFPEGEIDYSIFEMTQKEIKTELIMGISQAIAEQKEVFFENITLEVEGKPSIINISIKPFVEDNQFQDLLLIIFEETKKMEPEVSAKKLIDFKEHEKIKILEEELKNTKFKLQTTIEELETSNEELKSMNEELHSSNEELQSTNEELQTSQEELQSVNEELLTVNNELESKIEELTKINDDLENLMASTNIGTLFVDNDIFIKRFTPHITKIFNIIKRDIYRPLKDITTKLDYGIENLIDDINQVHNTLIPIKKTLKTVANEWYEMKIIPYRTIENKIDGAVISFFNNTDLKESEMKLRDLSNTAQFYQRLFLHDMSNIFQIILSANDFILKNKESLSIEKIMEHNETIQVALGRGLRLIKNVQKLTVDQIILPLKVIEPIKYLEESINEIKKSYVDQKIDLELNNESYDVRIKACELIRELFDNILINAIIHNKSEIKKIRINVSTIRKHDQNFIQIEFNDNGKGISDAKKKNLFSLNKSDLDAKSGMGIGLTLVKRIVELFNGEICVDDRIEGDSSQGTKFIVILPESNQK